MVRYYEYNCKDSGAKYAEITEAEYLEAKADPNRWFISFGSCVLECEKPEYEDYYKQEERNRYSRRDAGRKTVEVLSLEQVEEDYTYDMSVFTLHNELSVEETVSKAYQKMRLLNAIAQLTPNEAYLIQELHFKNRNQKELAGELGITQQAVSKRYRSTLQRLRRMLSDLE